jgi:hypothetical protein
MKKTASLGFLALALMVGCSTANKKYDYVTVTHPGLDQETLTEWAKPFDHVAERKPSSEIVGRPRYVWEADSLKISLTANATVNQNYNVRFNHYSIYEVNEKVQRTVSVTEERWERVEQGVLVCDAQEGAGKSELWNAFYAAPASQKQKALAKAIDGVGDVSAAALVKNQYFHSKPRSWSDFEVEIRRAANEKVITKSVEYQILYKYRSENMTKLGYNTQMSGVCRVEIQVFSYPREVIVQKTIWVDEVRTQRDLISTDIKNYQVRISGQRLQPFENEMLVFSFDRDSNQIFLSPTTYNNYSLSFDGQRITAQGISRKNIDLPNDVFPSGATLERSGGMANFTAPLNKLYIPRTATDGHILVSVRVKSCKTGMIGRCSLFKRDEQSQPVVVIQGTSQNLVGHKFSTTPGRTYWVEYWVNMGNSPWYTNNVVLGPNSPEI